MPRFWALIVLLLALSACQTNAEGNASSSLVDNNAIQWDRSPSTVVFRADITGGNEENSFARRNEVPPCTIYGDNRVVWLNHVGTYETQVLWDQVSDQAIRDFVTHLTISERFYEYEAQADVQPASAVSPVIETLTLFVSGQQHQSDAYSGWEGDYYTRILSKCQTLSAAPILFEPSAAWVSAEAIPPEQSDTSAFNIPWDAQASGLSLAELAASGERRWITDRNVRVLWNLIRNSVSNLRFTEGDGQFRVALEVPGVTRESPPAPTASS
jgi:hypothetical protein